MYEVVGTEEIFKGKIMRVRVDEVTMPGGGTALRECVTQHDAVGVVAVSDAGDVLLIRQYRHAVGDYLWELPAGLLDVDGEAPELTAARELAEETDYVADRFEHLVNLWTNSGSSNAHIRLYLATGVRPAPEASRHERTEEEADLTVQWVPLVEALAMIDRGELKNAAAVAGVLLAARR